MKVTSAFGYLAALLLVLAGWVGATVVAAGAWDTVRDSTLVPVTQERADARGSSVAVFTDIVQPERAITCRGVDPEDASVTIEPAAIDVPVEFDGTEWHLINLLPEGRDDLKIRCAPRDKRVDNATYTFAIVDGFTSRGERGQAIATTGLLAGLALASWTFICRRNLKKSLMNGTGNP
ncbi:MAG: hypothetical protein WB508_01650 [Aeromicrobium sp.]|uniref:hypothetical protein n=1 Tax=Aeromicrobium sp. TaxID=1871063 RepID=UPI003C57FFB7